MKLIVAQQQASALTLKILVNGLPPGRLYLKIGQSIAKMQWAKLKTIN